MMGLTPDLFLKLGFLGMVLSLIGGVITNKLKEVLVVLVGLLLPFSIIYIVISGIHDAEVEGKKVLKANGNADIVCYEGNLFSSTSFFIRRGEWKVKGDKVLWEAKGKAFLVNSCQMIGGNL